MKLRYYFGFFLSMLLLSSCMKEDDLSNLFDSPQGLSGVAVYNAAPGSVGINLSFNDDKFNKTGEKLVFGEYISYRNIYAGERTVLIENLDSTGEKQRITKNISLGSGEVYSLFLYKDQGLQMMLSKDNVLRPREGYAKIRLAHMVNDAPALAMWNLASGPALFGNVSFKTVTDFEEIKAGEILSLKIGPLDGKSTIPQIDLKGFIPANKGVYTLLIKGTIDTKNPDEEFGLEIIKL